MYIDQHIHSNISHDGISSYDEYVKGAKDKNIKEITFTEHYDIYTGIKTNLKTLDVSTYVEELQKVQESTKDIQINLGIEVGLQPDETQTINAMLSMYPFDFIIGSSHITCKKDLSKDATFFEGLTRRQSYLKYFKEVLKNVQLYENFDVYGHLDYIARYGGYANKSIEYKEFNEILDAILCELIRKDKGIEVNTSGIRYKCYAPHPNIEILKRYKELGGSIITIGSDAHKIDDLGSDFDKVFQLLQYLGFDEYAVFHKREISMQNIKR